MPNLDAPRSEPRPAAPDPALRKPGEPIGRRRLLTLGLGASAGALGARLLGADEARANAQVLDTAGAQTITGDWTFDPKGGVGSATAKDLSVIRHARLHARYPEFGAVGDGSIDDRKAIQAAIDACAARGGGAVVLDGVFGWTGELVVKNGVSLEGVASNQGAKGSGLRALDESARVAVGDWESRQKHPGGLRRLLVDGNGTGHPDGLVSLECVTATFESLTIISAAGKGLYLNAAQNNTFTAVDVFGCGVAVSLDNGAGGNLFLRCEHRGNRVGLEFIDGPGGNAYPLGPADNKWMGGIFETTGDGSDHSVLADIRCGAHNHFYGVGFSNNGGDKLSQGSQVVVSNPIFTGVPTSVHFDSCLFNGAAAQKADAIRVVGPNVVRVTGDTYAQHSRDLCVQDGGTGTLQIDGTLNLNPGTVANPYATRNGGSLMQWIVRDQGYVRTVNHSSVGGKIIDSAAFSVHRIALGAKLTSMTITNPVPGAKLRVMLVQGSSGKPYTWAPNMRFVRGRAPRNTTPNTATIVDFTYDGPSSKWLEVGRSVAVPLG